MGYLTIALLQLLPGRTEEESLDLGWEACRRAKTAGADLALFPEMWSSGYRIPADPEALRALAVPAEGPFVGAFGALSPSVAFFPFFALLSLETLGAY